MIIDQYKNETTNETVLLLESRPAVEGRILLILTGLMVFTLSLYLLLENKWRIMRACGCLSSPLENNDSASFTEQERLKNVETSTVA